MSNVPVAEWIWYGMPGHFIGARWCRWHLATEIGKVVVSSVGEYVPPYDVMLEHLRREAENSDLIDEESLPIGDSIGALWHKHFGVGMDIGWSRKYETMVFEFDNRCDSEECNCNHPIILPTELDVEGYNTRKDANEGHSRMCRRWARNQDQKLKGANDEN